MTISEMFQSGDLIIMHSVAFYKMVFYGSEPYSTKVDHLCTCGGLVVFQKPLKGLKLVGVTDDPSQINWDEDFQINCAV